ncbi:hypothetical protein [Actinomadura decatromicini]|uniref:Uncharacterized protein n=1 Tax=Actinomadura decatromicini TaxID=2604572 RepID=A0A5D3FB23_9ACTN|nr:hypothetical protein [Actinomadura decatromicini]TYK45138.1 hypothetical protein FXF68_31145 [Actinomadura decatromicini]
MDIFAPLALLSRTLAGLSRMSVLASRSMAHHQDPDRLITASLFAVATRHGGRTPTEDERKKRVAELREIATVRAKPRRGSLHPPAEEFRVDLLGEVAGILIGFAPDSHPEHHLIAADLLREAGADEDVVQQWIPVGRERREGGGPAFSRAESIGFVASPRHWP